MSLKIWLPLNGNIENQGTLNTTSRLPSGYTEVKYLRTTGSQHIDTGVIPDADMEIECTYRNRPGSEIADTPLFGSRDSSYDNSYTVWAHPLEYNSNTGVDTFIFNGSQLSFSKGYPIGTWQSIYLSKTQFINNDQKLNLSASSGTPNLSIILCGLRNGNTIDNRKFIGDIIKFSIKKGSSAVRNLIPALRNSDNKPGMYDTVTGTFYTNAGSGEFSVGPKVIAIPTIKKGSLVFNSVGKLGTTCTFDGSQVIDSGLRYNQITTGKLTICAWCNASTMSADMNVLGSELNNGGINFCEIRQSNNAMFYANNASGSDILCISSGTMSANTWYHFAYVIENLSNGTSKATLYRDGVYVNSVTYAGLVGLPDYPIYIGRAVDIYRINDDNNYQWKGMIQDIRIYDECLSADQIKEISRGIVLHYKMCQPERSENLLSNWCNITKWTSEGVSQVSVESDSKFNKVLTFTPSSGTMRIYYSTSNVWTTNGATFTVSGYVKSSSASTMRFSRSIADYGADVATTTSWKKFSTVITLTGTSTSGTLSIQGSSGIKYYLANLKLERGTNSDPQWSPAPSDNPNWGTIEYDGSGFKNHGTVSGNVTLSADSPRYTGSYKFGTNNYITTTSTGNYIKSATFWAKDAGSVPSDGLVFRDQNSGLAFGIQSGNLITGAVGGPAGSSSVPVSVSDAKYTANTWHFFACVNDNGTQRLYMDGIQISTGTGTGNWSPGSPKNSLNIGGRAGSSYWPGYISDFKMYVTVLSATDIQELYKLGRV